MNWRTPPQRRRPSLLFGRALRLGFLRLALRLWGRVGRRHGIMSSTRFYMGSAHRVLNRRRRRRVHPRRNNAFDSVAAGTSREECCGRTHCNNAYHDADPAKRCASNADKIRRVCGSVTRRGFAPNKVPRRARTMLTLPDPYRLLRNSARCALRCLRARNVFIFHASDVLSGRACGCIAPSANWPPAAPKGEASTQTAANKIRFRAFMSPLAVMRDAR